MSGINQKEYLKKYLSIGKDPIEKKKKKRKKIKNENQRLKIIDDNVDTFNTAVQEDLLGETEDAPQIVEVIDDRPPSLRIDEKNNTHLWIPIGGDIKVSNSVSSSSTSTLTNGDMSPPRRNKINVISPSRGSKRDLEVSRPRRNEGYEDICSSIKNESGEDRSPLIRNIKNDMSPPRRNGEGKDMSPPRRNICEDVCMLIKNEISEDISPLMPTIKEDMHSPGINRGGGDMSPPRRIRKDIDISLSRKNERCENMSSLIKNESVEDMYPPRRNKRGKYMSPPRSIRKDVNISPHRRKRGMEDMSLPKMSRWSNEGEHSKRNKDSLERRKESRWESNHSKSSKMMKTLDGKTAGLQNATNLVEETREIKRKEEELFQNLSTEVSGANASTIVRDRKTGKIRNLAEEAERDMEKLKRKAENEEKYSRWGKGLKQVEDAAVRRADVLNEINKPLARYVDDEDLERYLKEQEREGDPMLAYIRKKKKKQDVDEGKPTKPEYMGEFMPNRFGIRPGHRWDGVDRSNGYEKRWFEVQNSRLAQKEETYKWSTEDM